MLHVENNKITIDGTGRDTINDLACAIHGVYESMVEVTGEELAKKTMREVLELALMSSKELEEKALHEFQKGVTSTFLKAMLGM